MAVTTLAELLKLTQGQDDAAPRFNNVLYQILPFLAGVQDDSLTTPPGSPTDGDAYIPAATATGDWAGLEDYLVTWTGGEWVAVKPARGMVVHVNNAPRKRVRYNGSSWVDESDRLFITAQTLTVGSTTSSPFSITGEQPNTDTVTYGFPIPFACRVRSVIASIIHIHGSDPGDWTITIEDHGGAGSTYYSEDFELNASSLTAEVNRVTNSGSTNMSGTSLIQMQATGPSTSTIIIMATVELERIY